MPDPIPAVPPSAEQLVQEIRAWKTTPVGQKVAATGVAAELAASMARHSSGVDEQTLGEVLMRLASHLSGTIAVAPDVPAWMLANLVGLAGIDLIERREADA